MGGGGGSFRKLADPAGYYATKAMQENEQTKKVVKAVDPAFYAVNDAIQKPEKKEEKKPAAVPATPPPIVESTASGGGVSNLKPMYQQGGGSASSTVPYGMNNQQQSPFGQRIAASNYANQQISGQNQFTMPNTQGLNFGGGY